MLRALRRSIPLTTAIAALYWLLGQGGGLLLSGYKVATLVAFLPAGLALACAILFGMRSLAGILLGQYLLGLGHGLPLALNAGLGVFAVLMALTGGALFHRLGLQVSLARSRDLTGLLGIIFFLVQPVHALFGCILLWHGGLLSPGQFAGQWLLWWSGSAMAQLLLTPVILSFYTGLTGNLSVLPARSVGLGLAGLSLSALAGWLSFFGPFEISTIVLVAISWPVLLCIAITRPLFWASAANLVFLAFALSGLSTGRGPVDLGGQAGLLNLNAFILVFTLPVLYISSLFSERLASAHDLRLAASVFNHIQEGILITSDRLEILDANPSWLSVTGYRKSALRGQSMGVLLAGDGDGQTLDMIRQHLQQHDEWRGEVQARRQNGSAFPAALAIAAVRDEQHQLEHYVLMLMDISNQKAEESRLRKVALHDPLTGLPNRDLLMERLDRAMRQARRDKSHLAVCFMDLDGFKNLNDNHGHATGDAYLVAVARAIESGLREVDTVARVGGDEFVLLLTDLEVRTQVEPALKRIMEAVRRTAPEGFAQILSASIGVSLFPDDFDNAAALVSGADRAMYRAKESGRNRWVHFEPDMEGKVVSINRDLFRDVG
jgi:diguanylate cyclase (GGDEF)-like protein/PAS domain S-box-containing protein